MQIKKILGDILYPRRCAFCDGTLAGRERFLCARCRGSADPRLHLFENGFAPYRYRAETQAAVLRMKYADRPEYAAFFAESILRVGASFLKSRRVDAVVPIPIHRRRLAGRAYNQAEELARRIADRLRLPLRADLLLRVKNTKPQKGLDHAERAENMSGAFVCRQDRAIPPRLLLVDDIYTSGATIREAREVLLLAGAREVYAACATMVL